VNLSIIDCVINLNTVMAGSIKESAVVTECNYFFYEECLTAWVNSSAMAASNTCPSCRFVLCEPRESVHSLEFM
jgi:hypothetical protein